jgi:hypothetical protein
MSEPLQISCFATGEPADEKFKMKWHKSIACMLFISLCVVFGIVLLIFAAIGLLKTPTPELFRRYVLDPIPTSVMNIKSDRDLPVYRYAYTFSFKINESGLALLVKSRPFQKISNVKYDSKTGLYWQWDSQRSHTMSVYGPGQARPWWWQRKPHWFMPDRWDNPRAYAFEDKSKNWSIQVLLYNDKLGKAYFIVHTAQKQLTI